MSLVGTQVTSPLRMTYSLTTLSEVLNVMDVRGDAAGQESQFATSVIGSPLAPLVFSLHEEDLLKIFSFLSLSDLLHVSRVCRWWYKLSFDRVLWKDIDLRRFASRLTDSAKMELLVFKRLSTRIRCLDLSGFTVSDRTLSILASSSKQLRVLKLKSVTFTRGSQTDDLKGKEVFPDHLKYLDIRLSQGHGNVYRAIASSLSNIRQLGLCDAFLYTQIQNGSLKTTIESMENLRKLDLSHCRLLSDNNLALFARCRKLELLSVRKCILLTGSFVQNFLQSCTLLKTLILDGISIDDDTLQNIRWEGSKLTHLELGWCPLITSCGLNAVLPQMAKISSLEYLGLCATGDSKAVNDETLVKLETILPSRPTKKLKWLNISCSRSITKNGLRALHSLNSFVEILDTTNCPEIKSFRNVQTCDRNNNVSNSKVKGIIFNYSLDTPV